MNEHGYKYRLKPLLVPGLMFLIGYPLVTLGLYYLFKFSALELKILLWIYGVTALSIACTWVYAAGKSIKIDDNQIVMKTLLSTHQLHPSDIRKIVLFWTPQKKEVAQIVTKKDTYYVSDLYFAFPELMAGIERFVKIHSIRSNFATHGE